VLKTIIAKVAIFSADAAFVERVFSTVFATHGAFLPFSFMNFVFKSCLFIGVEEWKSVNV